MQESITCTLPLKRCKHLPTYATNLISLQIQHVFPNISMHLNFPHKIKKQFSLLLKATLP